MQRRTLAEAKAAFVASDGVARVRKPFHVFEAAVSMRFLQKRSKFGKVRRTGSNVHQRFLLPMCRAQATVATVAAAPFASFSGRTEKGGPARPERMLNFLFL